MNKLFLYSSGLGEEDGGGGTLWTMLAVLNITLQCVFILRFGKRQWSFSTWGFLSFQGLWTLPGLLEKGIVLYILYIHPEAEAETEWILKGF